MPYAREHLSKRVRATPLAGPVKRADPAKQRLIMAVGVAVSTLVILGLYAASFPYRDAYRQSEETPRWSVIERDFQARTEPLMRQWEKLTRLRDSMSAVLEAKRVQARSVEIMKAKMGSATATETTADN